MLTVGQRDDVVGIAVPEVNGDTQVAEREAPRSPKQDEVEDRRAHARQAAGVNVVEEHRLDLRSGEESAIALGRDTRVELVHRRGERPDCPHETREPDRRRCPQTGKDGREDRSAPDHAARRGIRTFRRGDTAEYRGGGDPFRQRGTTSQGIGTATGQTDECALLDSEPVGDDREVVSPVQDPAVQMRRRGADARPFDTDQAHATRVRRDARGVRDLAACTGRAVEPEHDSSPRRTELDKPQTPPVRQRHGPFDREAQPGSRSSASSSGPQATPRLVSLLCRAASASKVRATRVKGPLARGNAGTKGPTRTATTRRTLAA